MLLVRYMHRKRTSCHSLHILISHAIKSLNFVRLNLNSCTNLKSVESAAHLRLICPKLEYATTVWDPCLLKDITTIERIQ